jgi:uncharacterized protein (DUF2141 family)
MRKAIGIAVISSLIVFLESYTFQQEKVVTLTVKVDGLRNEIGNVQFALYNKDGSIPDEKYRNYYKIDTSEIKNHSSSITFDNLPIGEYAVNILHDENSNGKIDKGWVLPIEGVGFSNFQSVGLRNRPSFSKASFELKVDKIVVVKVIYF